MTITCFDGGSFYLILTTLSHHLHSNCALNTGGRRIFLLKFPKPTRRIEAIVATRNEEGYDRDTKYPLRTDATHARTTLVRLIISCCPRLLRIAFLDLLVFFLWVYDIFPKRSRAPNGLTECELQMADWGHRDF